MNNSHEDAVIAGRGFLFIAFAKLYFLITGTIVNLALPRLLGEPSLYGDFRVVNSFLSVLTMVMITGTIQAVSKLVSENEKNAARIKKLSLKVQSIGGVGTALLVFILSDVIANFLFNDADLASYLRISSLIILFYAFYAVYIGLFNGLKQFHKQAACDVVFSTIKTGLIILLVCYGFSVLGAFWGFAIASFLILPISIAIARRPIKNYELRITNYETISANSLLNYMIPIMLYTLVLNLLVQLDVLLLKSASFNPIRESFFTEEGKIQLSFLFNAMGFSDKVLDNSFTGISLAFASKSTSVISGIFGAAKNIALVPYQIVISITFVAFPLVSKSTFEGDQEKSKSQLRNAMRFALVLSALMMVSVLSEPEKLLAILFGQDYIVSATPLIFLLIGIVFFSLFSVGNALLTSAGHPKLSLAIGVIAVLINVVTVYVLIRMSEPDESLMLMVSIGVFISMSLSFIMCSFFVLRRFKAFLPFGTVLRTIMSALVILIGGSFISVHDIKFVLLKFTGAGFAFLILMIVSKEFTKNEFNLFKKIIFRRKG